MWTRMSEGNQVTLWMIVLIGGFVLIMKLLNVLQARSKRITVEQPDGARLEFRGMSAQEAAALNEAAQSASRTRASADDVRR